MHVRRIASSDSDRDSVLPSYAAQGRFTLVRSTYAQDHGSAVEELEFPVDAGTLERSMIVAQALEQPLGIEMLIARVGLTHAWSPALANDLGPLFNAGHAPSFLARKRRQALSTLSARRR